ncbi:MAG: phosphoribosyltransferase family protein, partial [Oleiphilaceae bacterium]|nr:phosphoribosyltransferase family protein [Oleiphilaceae bacterium]
TGQDKSTRLKNLKGSFSWEQCESLSASEHIAIVDDVMTTGATLTAVAHIAKANGVKRVDVWSIARTPKRG